MDPDDHYRTRAHALAAVLRTAESWQLTGAGAAALEQILDSADDAATRHDPQALVKLRGDLVMLTSTRFGGVDDTPKVPPHELPLERINELVHTLMGDVSQDRPPRDAADDRR